MKPFLPQREPLPLASLNQFRCLGKVFGNAGPLLLTPCQRPHGAKRWSSFVRGSVPC